MSKKKYSTGRLSKEHKRLIPLRRKQGATYTEIAEEIDRSPDGVRRYLESIGFIDESLPVMDTDAQAAQVSLKQKPYWRNLQAQFSRVELDTFEQLWTRMMLEQFRHDLLPAEELQVKQLLTLYIFVDRSAEERLQHIKEVRKLQVQLEKEYKVRNRDVALIDSLESRLAFARSAVSNHTTEHTKLLDKIEKINKDLKATRDQRVKRIEDAKTSFVGLIKALEDESYRKRVGREAELMNVAKDKVMETLGEYHEYSPGMDYAEVDVPILNAETVMRHDDI